MKAIVLRIFAVCIWFFFGFQIQTVSGQCTSGCTSTYNLTASTQTLSFSLSGGGNQVICITKDPAVVGTATVTSGTFDISNRPNTTLCIGPGVVLASGVNISNLNNQFALNNYGTLQNSLNINQTQQTISNFGTISGPVTVSNGTINNNSGASFTSTNFTLNSGNFVNNTGATFNIPGNFTAGSSSSFTGGGTFTVGGNFQTNNSSTFNITGAASISGSVATNAAANFGSTLTVGNGIQSNNSGPITVGGAANITGNLASNATISFGSSLTLSGNFQSNNGGPVTVAGAVSIGGNLQTNATTQFNASLSVSGNTQINNGGPLTVAGVVNLGGSLQTNATTQFNSTLSVSGSVQINNGGPITVSGATTLGSNLTTNASSNFGSSLSMTGNLQVNNGGPLTVGSGLSVGGSAQLNANVSAGGSLTISNSGSANPALTVNNGSTNSFAGGGNITGNFTNNGSVGFSGTLNATGTITNNHGASISSASGSCKTLCGSSIVNNGSISSTSGPNLSLCVAPSGSGTTTNTVVTSVPTAGPSGLSLSVSGSTVTGTFTAASPVPGGYMVIRKTSAINSGDMPVNGTSYSVGSTIGGATVVAFLAGSASSFSYSDGCGSFYFAVISSSSASSGSCGSYYTTSYATASPASVSCAGPRYWVSSTASTWNSTANWSVSSGGPSGASVPASGNLAIFDNARNGNCSINATVDVLGIQVSGYTGIISQNANPMTLRASGYSQSSGTFTGGSSAITLQSNGLFLLSGGTYTATSGTTTLTGGFNSNTTLFAHSAGTFNHNNGTWVFNPSLTSCANPTLVVDVLPATLFYNVEFNGVAGCGINAALSTGTGDVLTCANHFTHTDGILSGAFSFQGNLSIGSGADGGTGTLTAAGTGAQTHSQAAGSPRTCQLIVNKAAGAFTPAGGSTQLTTQGFSLLAGSFTAPSGTLNVGGNWGSSITLFNHSGGTFVHNNGTVEFNPTLISCANPTLTVDVLPGTLFYNFRVNGIAGCGINATLTTGSGDVITCANNLTHSDGILSGSFSFEGNLIINAGADGGTGTITANGTGAQTYTTSGGVPRTCQLIVNKASGALTPAGGTVDLFLQGFQLQAGSFTAPTGTLNVGGNWGSSVTIFGHSGGTFSHNNGTVEFNPTLVSCANPTFTIDVIPSTQFSQFVVNGIAGCGINATVSTAAGDVVQCLGDFTHSDGIISGSFSFQGNLWIYAGSDGGTGSITANGTGAQTYFQSSGSPRTCQLIVNKSAGALTPALGATNLFTQGFQLQAGDFTAPTGTLNVGGNWGSSVTIFGHSGGTYTHNNGTVEFNPTLVSCANPTFTVDVIPSTLLYNFVVNGIAGCGINATISTASGDVVQADNDFTHTDGIIAGNFAFRNNLVINSGADGGTGSITANGTGAQTYFQSSGSPRTCQLIVNKSAGALTPALGATNLFTQGFQLQAGDFTAPTGTLNVGGNWGSSVTIFGHSGGTYTHNNGTVEFNPTLVSCANPTFTVDVIPSTLLYNFVVNGIAGCGINATISTASGDVVQADNDFTHTDGIIAGNFAFRNNLVINAGADGGTGSITANGTAAQTYIQSSGSPRTCQLIVNKSAGALTPALGATNLFTQGFQLQAGSFTAPSGTLNVGGNWGSSVTIFGHSGGTYTHNNGTVEFNPTLVSCANPTFTVDVIPSTLLYNFVVNGIAGCGINATISTASGDVVQADNDFTHTDGIIAGNFAFRNNLVINSGADGGTGSITANGTGAQTYFQSSGSPRTCQLIVNKSAGALTPALGATNLFTQGFQLQAGSFTAPSGTLNVGGNWGSSVTIFGHSGGNYTHNNGTVEFNPTLVSCANPTFTVDVIPSTLLYNFVVNGIAGCGINATISTASGDVVQADNDFTHTDGIIAGNFAFRNNLVINAGADGGTGSITANGTGAQTYIQSSGSPRTCQLIVNKSAGALTPALGATNLFTQGFQLQAGSFTAPSGTLNVGGNWGSSVTIFGHSGGTYTHNNGTVEFNPTLVSCANPTLTVDVIQSTQLYTVLVNGIQGCGINPTLTTASGDTLEVTQLITYQDGMSNLNVEATGNVRVLSTFDGGLGFLLFGGGNSQTFDLTGATGNYNGRVILRKIAGEVTLGSACVLDAGVTQSLQFISGNLISTSTNLLTIGHNTSVSGASNASFVSGPVRKVGTAAFTFPVGKGSVYAAIGISGPAATGDHFTAEYFGTDPNSLYSVSAKEITVQSVSTCEYWNLERTGGSSNVTVTLTWAARSCPVSSVSTQGVVRWNGSQWINQGRSAASGTTSSGSVATCSVVSSFSSPTPFTLAVVETASIAYAGSPFCSTVSGAQPVSFSGLGSGAYTVSPAGLSLDAGTGAVTPSTSTAGTYTVTYTVPSSVTCANVVGTAGVTVSTMPAATISYPLSVFCPSAGVQNVTRTGTAGGTYSAAPSGLTLNSGSGQITPSTSSANNYTISYTLNAPGCPLVTANATVTVRATGQWLGGTTNWNTAGNWCGGIPTSTTDVLIPTGVSNMPVINGNSFARNLVLETGTTLQVSGSNSLTISGNFSNSGAFTPSGSSTIVYNGAGSQAIVPAAYANLSTSGGPKTFSGSLSISGTFSPSASSHDAGTSTIHFNGGTAQNIPAFTFYNLSTSGNNVKSMTGNVAVTNALQLGTGSLSIGANTLNLGGTIAGTGTLSGACTSTLTLSGPGSTGTLNFTAGARTLGNLNLSKSGAGDVTLGTDLDICTNLALSQGKVILGSNNLTLLSGANATGGNANSFVQTLDQISPGGAGFFHRQVSSGAGELMFPVGTNSYTPAYLDNIGSTRSFKVRVFNDVYAHGISGAAILNLDFSVRKTWEIAPTGAGGTPNVAIRLQWNSGDEGVYFYTNRETEKIYMGKNTGVGSSLWEKLITGDLDLAASPYSLTSARVTSFSKFAIGSDEAPLPVVMGALAGYRKDGQNRLSWSTYSETNSRAFEILRSVDGNQFEKVGEVAAAGNSGERQQYQFADLSGHLSTYYKLRLVGEEEGDITYSNTIQIVGTESVRVEISPQPATEKVQIRLEEGEGDWQVELSDLQGRQLPVRWEKSGPSVMDLWLENLPAGIYPLKISLPDGAVLIRRIVKS